MFINDWKSVQGLCCNTKAGTAKVTIKGVGAYGKTKVITFKITKKALQ